MTFLEDRICPAGASAPRVRDALCLGLLVALTIALLPALGVSFRLLSSAIGGDEGARESVSEAMSRNADEITAWCLLPALAFALALRRGAVDLSVWASAALGGLAAAGALRWGLSAGVALAAAVAAGLILGACNAGLVVAARIPSFVVTLVTGVAVVWACQAWAKPAQREVQVPQGAFDSWHMTRPVPVEEIEEGSPNSAEGNGQAEQVTREVWLPLRVTRMFAVGTIYSVVVLVLLILMARQPSRGERHPRVKLFAALCASGGLAAAGGMCWLLDHPRAAPIPTYLVGDLRIPAAAILAGAAFLGVRRTALSAMCLPAALVLASAWRQDVWDLPAGPYYLQVAVLGGMVLVVYIGFAQVCGGVSRPRWLASTAATLTAAGLLIVAACVYAEPLARQKLQRRAGLAMWLAGACLLVLSRVLSRRKAKAGEQVSASGSVPPS